MTVRVEVSRRSNPGEEDKWTEVELDSTSLMFFDVILNIFNCTADSLSEINGKKETIVTSIDISPSLDDDYGTAVADFSDPAVSDAKFDYFEYYDEDGDIISVRSDDELGSFVDACRDAAARGELLRVRLKSSRQLFSDSDDDFDEAITENSKNQEQNFDQIQPSDLQFVEKLSEGQFGTVYRALDIRKDTYLAVKSISLDGALNSRSGILNEIEILRMACSSPHVVNFYSAIFTDSELLICLELMDGLSLDRYGKLPPPILGNATVAVIDGLLFLWKQNIIHRDIKPSNFLVNYSGDVKLSDFGVSKRMAQSVAWSYVGTKVYMAPERINGELYTIHSDIWSLGMSLLEMALGRFPMPDNFHNNKTRGQELDNMWQNDTSTMRQVIESDELRPHGITFQTLVTGCLRRNPRERVRPSELVECEYICRNTPFDKNTISIFVNNFSVAMK